MSAPPPYAGCVALITGASRGIGRATAFRLASLGYTVAVNYRSSAEEAKAVVDHIEAAGGRAQAFEADLADPLKSGGLVARVQERLGPLDVLVNNAGITRDRLLLQMSASDWDDTWGPDLEGARRLATEAASSMMGRGRGSIVNVSSVVGATGNAGQANYAAAKSALHGLTYALAVRAARQNVRVNCVVPGYIVTDATSHLTGPQQDVWLKRIPMKRYAVPEEVVGLVAFLAGNEASYVTGQCISVDGGFLAQSTLGAVS